MRLYAPNTMTWTKTLDAQNMRMGAFGPVVASVWRLRPVGTAASHGARTTVPVDEIHRNAGGGQKHSSVIERSACLALQLNAVHCSRRSETAAPFFSVVLFMASLEISIRC
jgi:hypothetical protein